VDDFVGNEIGQRTVSRNFAPGWTDQTISWNFGAPQKNVLIHPRLVHASGVVGGIGEKNEQPSVITDEYPMLQPGIVESRPVKALLHISEDGKYRRRNGPVGVDRNVLGAHLVTEERIRQQHQRRIERESQSY
jgi:hypothetical protein